MANDRALLPESERMAAKASIQAMVDDQGSEQAVASFIGVSQAAINKVRRFAEIGPVTMRKLCEKLGVSPAALAAAYSRGEVISKSVETLSPKDEAIKSAMRLNPLMPRDYVESVAAEMESHVKGMRDMERLEVLLRAIHEPERVARWEKFVRDALSQKAARETTSLPEPEPVSHPWEPAGGEVQLRAAAGAGSRSVGRHSGHHAKKSSNKRVR